MMLEEKLVAIGVDNPLLESRWIRQEYPNITDEKIDEIVTRRARGEPLSRIFGWREFYGRRFDINEYTLDPRPDSETLIDAVLKYNGRKNSILDMGTGTGCLLITLLCEMQRAHGTAVDVSMDAIHIAQKNVARHECDDRIKFVNSNWFDHVTGVFDVIISNPPYIRSDVILDLDESVKNFDPILALDGGLSGIEPYKKLLSDGKKFLADGGRMFFEIGFDQAEDLARLVENHGATLIHIHKDLGGHDRVVEIAF
jgi:release factor glutamine methyltransferase